MINKNNNTTSRELKNQQIAIMLKVSKTIRINQEYVEAIPAKPKKVHWKEKLSQQPINNVNKM